MHASVGRGAVSAIGGLVIAVALHAIDPADALRAQTPQQRSAIEAIQVRPNVWMLAGAGGNIVVHIGWMGAVLVDTGSTDMSDQVLAAIQRITDSRIRFIINTGADPEHVGGNDPLARAGRTLLRYAPNVGNFGGSDFQTNFGAAGIMAHENVLTRMSAGGKAAYPATAWPTEAFTGVRVRSLYLNGDGVQMFYQPAAHSDADTIVFFRRADVIVAGDVLDLRHFPIIDLDNGGTIDGEIAALNRLIDLTVPPAPLVWHEDRTLVIPGHGRIADQADVVEYRDMVTVIRDRIADMIKEGHDARADQESRSDQGISKAIRTRQRAVDQRHVRHRCVPEPHGEVMRRAARSAMTIALLIALPAGVAAQRGNPQPPATARAAAPIDLTGYWVAEITEDWRWRMVTPAKGDYQSIPITPAAQKVADAWDPAKDEAAGEPCKSYGAPGLMRAPTRLQVTWLDENTLRVEADHGMQTRPLHFGNWKSPGGAPTLQGESLARWQTPGGRGARGGTLVVDTSRLRPGYLRKNGVPYGAQATMTEYWDLIGEPSGEQRILLLLVVEDPVYLQQPWVVPVHFKKEPDSAKWDPMPCSAKF